MSYGNLDCVGPDYKDGWDKGADLARSIIEAGNHQELVEALSCRSYASDPSRAEKAAYNTSTERVNLIAKRALETLGHSSASFTRAEPLLAKDMVKIFYKEGSDAESSVDARISDASDVEQLEIYRAAKAVIDKANAPVTTTSSTSSDQGGCILL